MILCLPQFSSQDSPPGCCPWSGAPAGKPCSHTCKKGPGWATLFYFVFNVSTVKAEIKPKVTTQWCQIWIQHHKLSCPGRNLFRKRYLYPCDGGSFLACEDLGECRPFILQLHFLFFILFFLLKSRLARAHQFNSLCQDQSTVAQQAAMTVAECSLTSCM